MGFPKKIAPFSAQFVNVGDVDEALKILWTNEDSSPGLIQFLVGSDCFLESPVNTSQVPDDQLMMSLSMSAILAGQALAGTSEFFDAVTNQDTMNFQTIIGNVKLKANPVLVVDPTIGPDGTVYDVEFLKVGTSTNTKIVRADAWSLCQYSNREASRAHAVHVLPGSIHKQFGYKKSQLGAVDSANRLAVIAYVAATRFWV